MKRWLILSAMIAVCLTGCGTKDNEVQNGASRGETSTTDRSLGDDIMTDISDVADDIGEFGKDVLTDVRDAADDMTDDMTGNEERSGQRNDKSQTNHTKNANETTTSTTK